MPTLGPDLEAGVALYERVWRLEQDLQASWIAERELLRDEQLP